MTRQLQLPAEARYPSLARTERAVSAADVQAPSKDRQDLGSSTLGSPRQQTRTKEHADRRAAVPHGGLHARMEIN